MQQSFAILPLLFAILVTKLFRHWSFHCIAFHFRALFHLADSLTLTNVYQLVTIQSIRTWNEPYTVIVSQGDRRPLVLGVGELLLGRGMGNFKGALFFCDKWQKSIGPYRLYRAYGPMVNTVSHGVATVAAVKLWGIPPDLRSGTSYLR